MPGHDRRHHARTPLRRAAKLRCDQSPGRYLSAWTQDVSAGGVHLQLQDNLQLTPGQRVRVVIADNPRQAVLRADAMVQATVVRSLSHEGAGHLALRFDHPVAQDRAA